MTSLFPRQGNSRAVVTGKAGTGLLTCDSLIIKHFHLVTKLWHETSALKVWPLTITLLFCVNNRARNLISYLLIWSSPLFGGWWVCSASTSTFGQWLVPWSVIFIQMWVSGWTRYHHLALKLPSLPLLLSPPKSPSPGNMSKNSYASSPATRMD